MPDRPWRPCALCPRYTALHNALQPTLEALEQSRERAATIMRGTETLGPSDLGAQGPDVMALVRGAILCGERQSLPAPAVGSQARAGLEWAAAHHPRPTLKACLEHLGLEALLSEAAAELPEPESLPPDWGLSLGPEQRGALPASRGDVSASLERGARVPLFELCCQLLHRVAPGRLLAFVGYVARVRTPGADGTLQGIYYRRAAAALPWLSYPCRDLSRESVLAQSELLCTNHVNKVPQALSLLLRCAFWEDALNLLASHAQHDVEHTELFHQLTGALLRESLLRWVL